MPPEKRRRYDSLEEELIEKAQALIDERKDEDAIQALEKLIALAPEKRDVSETLKSLKFRLSAEQGTRAYEAGEYEKAIDFWTEALKFRPGEERVTAARRRAIMMINKNLLGSLVQKGEGLFKEENYSGAIQAWRDALRLKPGDAKLLAAIQKATQLRDEQQKEELVLLEGAPFLAGVDKEKVELPAFYIDKYPVTNKKFRQFKPTHEYPRAHEMHPAVNVTWEEAAAYAEYVGMRLPTESEWEKASRGVDGREYPWGDEFDPHKCNTREFGGRGRDKKTGTTPVDAIADGASPYGCYDMVGNTWEWTASWYDETKKERTTRGGCSTSIGKASAKCTTRDSFAPDAARSNLGFRCAKDA